MSHQTNFFPDLQTFLWCAPMYTANGVEWMETIQNTEMQKLVKEIILLGVEGEQDKLIIRCGLVEPVRPGVWLGQVVILSET